MHVWQTAGLWNAELDLITYNIPGLPAGMLRVQCASGEQQA